MSSGSTARDRYDKRYSGVYRAELSGYEKSRYAALSHFIPSRLAQYRVRDILDYGAGRGLYLPLWHQLFPEATLSACDVSEVALSMLKSDHASLDCGTISMVNDLLPRGFEESFDLILSVEVMEHVEALGSYLEDVFHALRPGGAFIWTTPCANPWSIEYLYARLFGKVERSVTGEKRWAWEEHTHLRRLTSVEAATACRGVGFNTPSFAFRAHFFSFVVSNTVLRRLPERWTTGLMNMDYTVFRCLPNGASMIGMARKPTDRD